MSLKQCPHCRRKVAVASRWCPHCGGLTNAKQVMVGCLVLFILLSSPCWLTGLWMGLTLLLESGSY